MQNSQAFTETDWFLQQRFRWDELRYNTLDYRGAAVATKEQVDELAVELIKSLNNIQLIYGGVSAIGIAIGFLMLNTGSISLKNTNTMLRVSLIENMVCAICIWCLGYQVSMDSIGGLIGTGLDLDIFRAVPDKHCMKFIVLFACAQFTSAITTGALAERTYVDTQIAFKVMLNVLIYPIVASWVWGDGWLAKYGYLDFGGSGVVHIVGGTCGLVGAAILGPRLGLFNDSLPIQENKIREKLERLEHQFLNLQNESAVKLNKLRDLSVQYNSIKEPTVGRYEKGSPGQGWGGSNVQQLLRFPTGNFSPFNMPAPKRHRGAEDTNKKGSDMRPANGQRSHPRDYVNAKKTLKSLLMDPTYQRFQAEYQKASDPFATPGVFNESLAGNGGMPPTKGNGSDSERQGKHHRSRTNIKRSMTMNDHPDNLGSSMSDQTLESLDDQPYIQQVQETYAFQKLSKKERHLMHTIVSIETAVKNNYSKL